MGGEHAAFSSPLSMTRFHALRVAELRRLTPDSVAIGFEAPGELKAAFAFTPGQYLTLRATIDGEDIRRCYSLCSTPADPILTVGVKQMEGGAFSTFANQRLRVGDMLDVMAPEGRFGLPGDQPGRHALAIAAGSGITPVLSIARSLLASDPAARFTLIYGNRTSASVMFAEELEDLKDRYLDRVAVTHVLSREPQDSELLHGRIDAARLRAFARGSVDLSDVDDVLLCGPEAMIAEARATLIELGFPPRRIHAEVFTPAARRQTFRAPEGVAAQQIVAEIDVKLDGHVRHFAMLASDENVIDAAAREGLDLPYSCKGGMCCTCRCRVMEGEVEMAVNYSLEPWELEAGFRLACQSRPKTARLSLDFDQI